MPVPLSRMAGLAVVCSEAHRLIDSVVSSYSGEPDLCNLLQICLDIALEQQRTRIHEERTAELELGVMRDVSKMNQERIDAAASAAVALDIHESRALPPPTEPPTKPPTEPPAEPERPKLALGSSARPPVTSAAAQSTGKGLPLRLHDLPDDDAELEKAEAEAMLRVQEARRRVEEARRRADEARLADERRKTGSTSDSSPRSPATAHKVDIVAGSAGKADALNGYAGGASPVAGSKGMTARTDRPSKLRLSSLMGSNKSNGDAGTHRANKSSGPASSRRGKGGSSAGSPAAASSSGKGKMSSADGFASSFTARKTKPKKLVLGGVANGLIAPASSAAEARAVGGMGHFAVETDRQSSQREIEADLAEMTAARDEAMRQLEAMELQEAEESRDGTRIADCLAAEPRAPELLQAWQPNGSVPRSRKQMHVRVAWPPTGDFSHADCLAADPDSNRGLVVAMGGDGEPASVCTFMCGRWTVDWALQGHEDAVCSVALNADLIASGSLDHTVGPPSHTSPTRHAHPAHSACIARSARSAHSASSSPHTPVAHAHADRQPHRSHSAPTARLAHRSGCGRARLATAPA